MIYSDTCNFNNQELISKNNINLILRPDISDWSVHVIMGIVTIPDLKLAIFNKIDDYSLIEIGLFNFMCKKILVTAKSALNYPALMKTVDYFDLSCNLDNDNPSFIEWYKTC